MSNGPDDLNDGGLGDIDSVDYFLSTNLERSKIVYSKVKSGIQFSSFQFLFVHCTKFYCGDRLSE